jgi:hypothetical protein
MGSIQRLLTDTLLWSVDTAARLAAEVRRGVALADTQR